MLEGLTIRFELAEERNSENVDRSADIIQPEEQKKRSEQKLRDLGDSISCTNVLNQNRNPEKEKKEAEKYLIAETPQILWKILIYMPKKHNEK